MPRSRIVLLEYNGCEGGEVVERANEFDRSVLQSIMVNEVTLIEVCVAADLLPVVLVKHPYILGQVALIVQTMKTLARPKLAQAIGLVLSLVTDAFVRHKCVARHIN